jgi:hypothetical protein
MKKLSMVVALAFALFALPGLSAYADASTNGCEHSGGKAAGCSNNTAANDPVSVPEPTSFVLLAAGLLVCGGAVFGRKHLVQN